jgi:hypothetical protein
LQGGLEVLPCLAVATPPIRLDAIRLKLVAALFQLRLRRDTPAQEEKPG